MIDLIDKHNLYARAFNNVLDEYNTNYADNTELDRKPIIKKLIVYGVKLVNIKGDIKELEITTKEDAEIAFNFIEIVKDLMALLTPREFVQMYPIAKEYKGHKYSTKDYFYTVDYIKEFDQDSPIGDKILEFLWEYHNWELTDFNVEAMSSISKLRQFQGERSLGEEFAEMMGIKTYTMNTDDKGRQFLFDKETGKTSRIKIKNPKAKHLRSIK